MFLLTVSSMPTVAVSLLVATHDNNQTIQRIMLNTLESNDTKTPTVRFTFQNMKLQDEQYIFSLPAGHTCPGASSCLARVNRLTGRLTDGPLSEFRCFSASAEAVYKGARELRWNNLDALQVAKTTSAMASIILDALPIDASLVRIHVSGDFFSLDYFDAWCQVASQRPNVLFYAYTKSLHHWVARLGYIPSNLRLVASYGGKYDELIEKHNLRFARVVYSKYEARKLKLQIDHDDSLAFKGTKSFALLVHGTQAKGSRGAKSWQAQKLAKAQKAHEKNGPREFSPELMARAQYV